ncbi:uncharacterized protein [Amphiura filiformis]|uniref:uncharacterized protein n=1 Tax=Amphiura filiformis TaxID=82378 RepID=UPI003B211B5C
MSILILLACLTFVDKYELVISLCDEGEYSCADGQTCIPGEWRCDYNNDCGDNSDEVDGCVCDPSIEFNCTSGGCINGTWLCDGESDCFNGSDEAADLCVYITETPSTEDMFTELTIFEGMTTGYLESDIFAKTPISEAPASECYFDPLGRDYRGRVNQTIHGTECQSWTAQYPHEHDRTPENFPDTGLGEHNYCRNPDNEHGPWCYTAEPGIRWVYCLVHKCKNRKDPFIFRCKNGESIFAGFQCDGEADCQDRTDEQNCDPECYTPAAIPGKDYRGYVAVARSFRTCQKWTSQYPHQHSVTPDNYPGTGLGDHNYCRNPNDELEGPWCYTTDPRKIYEFCNVGEPRMSCNDVDIPKNCGGRLTQMSGIIMTPNYPSPYPHSARCTWIIDGPELTTILLNITEFVLQNANNGMCNDWLRITQNKRQTPTEIQQEVIYCGSYKSHTMEISGNYLWLQFISNSYMAAPGFSIYYEIDNTSLEKIRSKASSRSAMIIGVGVGVTTLLVLLCVIAVVIYWKSRKP